MNKLNRASLLAPAALLVAVGLSATAVLGTEPPAKPADIKVDVAPPSVAAGQRAQITVHLAPIEGVKINKYPKIKLTVPGREGLVAEAETSVGNPKPPPPDQMKTNYFDPVEPLEMALDLDASAPAGSHTIEGKISYFYCVPASGFCAPKRETIQIPLEVK